MMVPNRNECKMDMVGRIEIAGRNSLVAGA